MRISVLCERGPKAEERPCAFHLGGRRLHVMTVLASWGDAPHRYFEVAVDDGRRFVLHHDLSFSCWELAGVFAAARPPRERPAPAKASRARSAWWRLGFGK
ncbi:MAG TPA: hypothetical protein VFC18_01390 [Burkholderiales bacterium]|nr:hypothetical protein [Burkholderiales bacterium]